MTEQNGSASLDWCSLEELFAAALDAEAPERQRLLDACGDRAVADAVARLLARHERLEASPARDPLRLLDVQRAAALVDESPHALVGRTLGRFRILRLLGRGAMGTVYLASDPALDRSVALKLLPAHLGTDAMAIKRFREEARIASALDHPNVVAVHDVGEADDGRLFIAMAYCPGGPLRERLVGLPLPIADVTRVLGQLAAGLAAAHAVGVVHRDLKPENLLFGADGALRIADFGIAKAASRQLTRTGATLGTALYMSPEQTRGTDVGPQADIWAVGVVLYEMLAGRRPFGGAEGEALVYAIRHDQPTPIEQHRPDVPGWLAHLVAECLEKDPGRRGRTAADIVRAVETEGRATPVAVRTSRVRERTRRAAAALALLGAGVTLVTLSARDGQIATAAAVPAVALPAAAPPDVAPPAVHRDRAALAYELYMRGRLILHRRDTPRMSEAAEYFREAIALDSSLARAYVGLADVYAFTAGRSANERARHARPLLERALVLDATLASAHRTLGWLAMWTDRDWAAAERHLVRALALDPGDVWAHRTYAAHLAAVGLVDSSLAVTRHAAALEPTSTATATHLGLHLLWTGHTAEAIAVLERGIASDTSWQRSFATLARAYLAAGRYDDALPLLDRGGPSYAGLETDGLRAYGLALAGRREEARQLAATLEARARGAHVAPVNLVAAYLGLGDRDRALAWAERIPDDRGTPMFLLADPIFAPLRGDPRFEAVLTRLGLGGRPRS